MIRIAPAFCAALAAVALSESTPATPAPRAAASFTDATYGFKLDVPSFPKLPASQAMIRFTAFAPPVSGFASNVNVAVQENRTTRAEFVRTSKREFQTVGFTLDSATELEVSSCEAVRMEYHGVSQGHKLRWLALAVIAKERVYILTCTAAEDEFAKLKDTFAKCVESFALSAG